MSTEQDSTDVAFDEIVSPLSDDIQKYVKKVYQAYSELVQLNQKPVVLLIGQTGVGKSSIINTLFKEVVALEGETTETTEGFNRYASEKISIYDSKGFSGIETKKFMGSLKNFLTLQNERKRIHLVWFVINSAVGRLQPFEEEICKTLLNDVPVCFVLNKADLSSQMNRTQLKKSILEMGLKSCLGVFETVAGTVRGQPVKIDKCPKCGGDELVCKIKTKTMMCCKCMEEFSVDSQESQLIETTLNHIPPMTKKFFISSQKVNFKIKDDAAKMEVIGIENEIKDATVEEALEKIIKRMINISIVFECKKSGDENATKKFFTLLFNGKSNLTKKIMKLIKGDDEDEKAKAFAIAVEWYRALRSICWSSIQSPRPSLTPEQAIEVVKEALEVLEDGELEDMRIKLESFGLEEVLKECQEWDIDDNLKSLQQQDDIQNKDIK
ncbi:hypothetical protein EHI8A_101870 [Entamoeba histolytica HM-1:IMSS-B]|uniref:G domain-containing protein n=6 Tax=Entamoeba histolytica TaxID=5759 RepID=B1N432_ENTH1|nr:hypothetical protein EHI_007360 [Entamoeba histolytica HM-1:IMSS]EMD48502.1 Hypothetical protein EHI5A_130770 [Entamoeba histolytica KU27]EMH72063.1 hypothetical protein EHI8A_101870 [Entamoeba histolytica HM-1:IMSS-B]EMS11279.1 hypothetical protein KM1_174550 [Entamoeba histolytica HM-3:IMSS]ENY62299.1 hypothetical protein EHI7A_097130 [Entamoeba histolytica HM-1:IMSS-A]GAT97433.1 hypothetical protein CL6EHI_007360 [Entamoeba histolytica]|eukprot:XP_001913948.1 hypothetical protein EHI_007360 [Entamoeba histolytica HM-1:IMSS]